MPFSIRQHVELFHLLFLRALFAKAEDKKLFALKGGCNLRFFFQSVRFSEDIDLDVVVTAPHTLERKIDRILEGPTVKRPLAANDIEIVDVTKPKQTDTTHKWKLGLRSAGLAQPVRTKIEISRRPAVDTSVYEAVNEAIVRAYALPTFLASHYPTSRAVIQKIHALDDRKTPQARDVFDLNLLLSRDRVLTLTDEEKAWVPGAVAHARELSFDHYSAHVIAFLEPDQRELFEGRDVWRTMQDFVCARLEALR